METEYCEFVYIIRQHLHNFMKIGKASDPIKRLKELQTGNPNLLYIWATIRTNCPLKTEALLHEKFKLLKAKGEWFYFKKTNETQNMINDALRNEGLIAEFYDFNYSPLLMCHVSKLEFVGLDLINVYLFEGDCVDMNGCIKLCKLIIPSVQIIQTYSGRHLDTVYFLDGNEWCAKNIGPLPGGE